MTVGQYIEDPATGKLQRLDDSQSARISIYDADLPPVGTRSRRRYLTGLIGSTGLNSGTTNMNVDGSSTAQEFYIGANDDYDTHIMAISILIGDTGVSHQNFGTLGALSTGWDLFLDEDGETTTLIDKATTNGQVIVYTGSGRPFGDSATSWELSNWTATEDAILCYYTFSEYLGDQGLRIGRGTQDKLRSVVNDDVTGLTDFFVRVFGYRKYPVGK